MPIRDFSSWFRVLKRLLDFCDLNERGEPERRLLPRKRVRIDISGFEMEVDDWVGGEGNAKPLLFGRSEAPKLVGCIARDTPTLPVANGLVLAGKEEAA